MPRTASQRSREGVPPDSVLRQLRIPFVRRASLIHGQEHEDVFVIDLGLAGIFIERREPLPVGAQVEIRLPMPESEIPLQARCRVAWWHPEGAPLASKSLPAGAGLEFLEMSPSDQG